MSAPLVSILTPSFNQAAWLGDNLNSVRAQTHPHIEHVVMDGGSTDATRTLLEAAGSSIVFRSEADNGQADAINKAFALSTGDIVGWINSDDAYVDSEVIADVVRFFDLNPDVDVAYGHCLQVSKAGHVIQILWAPTYSHDLLRVVDFIPQPGAFIRRRALSNPMLDPSFHFAMDYELWLRLAQGGAQFGRIPRITAIDRHQPQRKSLTMQDVHAANMERLSQTYGAILPGSNDLRRSLFYLQQRFAGARLISRVPSQLAFETPPDHTAGLLRRQVASRKSHWPIEYR